MSKAVDMAKISVKGGVHVMWGLVISTVISAVGAIVIAALLGEENYGLYTIALTAPNLIALFRDFGTRFGIVRYAAQFNDSDNQVKIRRVFLSGFIINTLIATVFSIVCFLLSGFLADQVFHRAYITPLIQIVSFSILAGSFVNTATAAFTGVEQLHYNSIMTVCQSIIKTVLVIILVIMGLGTYGALVGYTVSFVVTGLIGLLMMWVIYKNLPKLDGELQIWQNIKMLVKYGLPLSLSTVFLAFLTQFYTFLLAIYVTDNALIGNYGVAQNFIVLITFFTTPITTMLFPAFSKIDSDTDHETLENVYRSSVKYSALIIVPVATLVMALAEPAVSTLFQGTYAEAPLFLALLCITYLYAGLGYFSISSLVNSQDQPAVKFKMTIISLAVGAPLGFWLIASYGVMGLLITTFISNLPILIIGLLFIKKRYHMTFDWICSGKIYLSAATAGIITYITAAELALPSFIRLIIGVFAFSFVFLTLIVLTKVITKNDIKSLDEMIDSLGILKRPLHFLLSILAKIIIKLKI